MARPRRNDSIPQYVSPADVKEALRCSKTKAHQLVRQAGGVKIGGMLRVTVEEWTAFIDRVSEPPRPEPTPFFLSTPEARHRRKLGPFAEAKSMTPLIPIRYRRIRKKY